MATWPAICHFPGCRGIVLPGVVTTTGEMYICSRCRRVQ